MLTEIAFAAMAVASSAPSDQPGLLIGTDNQLSTSVRLVETDDIVRFEITGPDSVAPTVSIDINRNGTVDRNVDFQVGLAPGDTPCLAYMLDESSSTTCKLPGDKANVVQARGEQGLVTTISFPKREISGDGFGFGFAIRLWSMAGHFGSPLAGGDYRFGGKLSLVTDGPNFTGAKKSDSPPGMLAALRRYQGCVNKAMEQLGTLDRTMGAKIRALPAACAGERSKALDEGINALVDSGTQKDAATEMMRSSLDRYDEAIGKMAETLEKGG